jgi:hypothetical protein
MLRFPFLLIRPARVMTSLYILGPGHIPVPEPDAEAWGQWYATTERHVADDEIAPGVRVSTVFLGIDHNFGDRGPPILFETMVFDDYEDGRQIRYATWGEALAGHQAVVAELTGRIRQSQTQGC